MGDLARVNTNVAALRAFSTLTSINNRIIVQQERISTGKIVNRASDSPSGYFISRKLNRDISALDRKQKNIERGMNFLQTNDTRLAKVADMLLEMSDLANQANSIAVTSAEKQAIQQDLTQLSSEITDILQSGVSASLYTGFTLGGLQNVSLTGTGAGALPSLSTLTIDGTNISITGSANASTAIANINTAMDVILRDEERIGSFIRRLQFEMDIASAEKTDTIASLSTIQDADLAEEQLELTKLQILQQSALAVLAQANAAPQSILMLFGG